MALLRTLQKAPAPSSRLFVPLRVAVMKSIVKHNLQEKYTTETSALKHQWDQALTLAYSGMYAEQIPVETFFQMYKDLMPLCDANPAHIEKIINCAGSWADVQDEVQLVTEKSRLGKQMCGFVSTAIVSCLLGKFIADKVMTVCRENTIALRMCMKVHEEVQQQGVALQAICCCHL